ncbi:MAG: protoporphyrinogen oxidase HemJ [Beijerinckiaceae bacterium]
MEYYLWIKALHIIADIAWMAGMLYLPRLFVYHADSKVGSEQSETFKIMERRLLRYIMTPAMLVAWGSGLYLAWQQSGFFAAGWFQAKLLMVAVMSGLHGYAATLVKDFALDSNTKTSRFYRIFNEIPTLLMIGAVILVVVKPYA